MTPRLAAAVILPAVAAAVLSCSLAGAEPAAGTAVQVREETLVLPTYTVGPPDPNPIFYSGRNYQGAKGPVYPYALQDRITGAKSDRAWRALVLENEYLKVTVLPEIGGRVFEARDKTNGYDFVYRQHVIKPALIGMLGAWISGGAEWNVPHHHRASTYMTVDSATERLPDGGATLWVGEVELRHRTKWLVGLTLRPGRSALEVTFKVLNRTGLPWSMLCFANVAVHANPDYQVLFPPSTRVATFHAKNQFSRWPVSREVFNGQDYTRGVDASFWKSHAGPTSFFAFDAEEDFLGGYDHGRGAGIAMVGDHHVVPGKKLWTWGTGSPGKIWEDILTDADGPYLELMVGSWSDNQPDYSWTRPGDTREVTQTWYPLRETGGLKAANAEAACNLTVAADGRARIAFNTTSPRSGLRAVLRRADGGVLFESPADVAPDRPFAREAALPPGTRESDLVLELLGPDGAALVRYAPPKLEDEPLPSPVAAPPAPAEVKTIEELYFAGLRLEQFYNSALEPEPYYREALRRDPLDSRANTALAILEIKKGSYAEAEKHLRAALVRPTANYTRPKETEPHYYLGLALRALGRDKEAEDAFQRAAWSSAWQAPAMFELARIASGRGDVPAALSFLERSLDANARNTRALDLRAALLRRVNRDAEAVAAADRALSIDRLDVMALREREMALAGRGDPSGAADARRRRAEIARDAAADVLEPSSEYAAAGLWEDASAVLRERVDAGTGGLHPMVAYSLAYCLDRAGRRDEAAKFAKIASGLKTASAFPYRVEDDAAILEWAKRLDPKDARAPYHLGNLLFDVQPERAIAEWEASAAIDPTNAIVRRNLGTAYARTRNDPGRGMANLEKAIELEPGDPRYLLEWDIMAEATGVPEERRLSTLTRRQAVTESHDDSLSREIGLLVRTGRYDRAIALLEGHTFNVWEGGRDVHGLWEDAHLLRGEERLRTGRAAGALADFEAALEYPKNLRVGVPMSGAGSAEIFYRIGTAHEALGNAAKATEFYGKAAACPGSGPDHERFRGLARQKLAKSGLSGMRPAD